MPDEPQLIWSALLDKVYVIEVTRTGDYSGLLRIYKADAGISPPKPSTLLFEKPVGLSYRALFGPDISDVNEWQGIACEFVDSQPKEAPDA